MSGISSSTRASEKPFGFQAFYPGPGLGGHCIPIDPFYLTWVARKYGMNTRFIELAGEVNTAMPHYVVTRIAEALMVGGLPADTPVAVSMAATTGRDDVRRCRLDELAAADVSSPAVIVIGAVAALDLQLTPFVPAVVR